MRRIRRSRRGDATTHALARAEEQGEGRAKQTGARHEVDRESGVCGVCDNRNPNHLTKSDG